MDLTEFFDYKNRLMKELCSNEDIVKLITENEDARVPNHQLAYTNIHPYRYVPDTASEAKTFICFDMDILTVPSKTYYVPMIYIWIFSHNSKLRLKNGGGLLIDRLCIDVAKMLNGSRFYGLGELMLESTQVFKPTNDYMGREMIFKALDFNNMTAGARTPGNRKRGL